MTLADRIVFGVTHALVWLRYPFYCADFSWRRKAAAQFVAPQRLNELVQWRKLFDHNPLFVTLTDKLAAKDWVRQHLPELNIPEVVWVGDRAEELPEELISSDYVIKTNHASHQNYFPGREQLKRADLNRRLNDWLSHPYRVERQWAYLGVKPKLFVERLVRSGQPLFDISFRVHGGRPSAGHLAIDFKTATARSGYFSADGRRIELPPESGSLADDFAVPAVFHRAAAFASRLGRDADYFRVDFLCTENEVYFGEITIYPASGMGSNLPPADYIYRSWLAEIERSWFLSTPQPWPLSLYAGAFRRWARRRNVELADATVADGVTQPRQA